MDVLEDTHELEYDVPHRPGKLYKFNYLKYKTKEGRKFMRLDF
jgi:8-oxo-dGTP diphosphatase